MMRSSSGTWGGPGGSEAPEGDRPSGAHPPSWSHQVLLTEASGTGLRLTHLAGEESEAQGSEGAPPGPRPSRGDART